MWQFENDKIWDSYSNRGVIKESFDDEMTEEELKNLISDIYSSYKDDNSVEDIAEEYGVDVKDVEDAINITKKQLSGENSDDVDLTDEFELSYSNINNTVNIDPDKRGDTIDYENARKHDEIHGKELYPDASKGNVTNVDKQKSRRQMFGKNKSNF